MTENTQSSVVQSPRILYRVAGIILLASVVVSWFAWGLSALALYLLGLSSYSLLVVFPCFVLLLIPIASIYVPMRTVRMISPWCGLDGRKWCRRGLTAIAAFVFVGTFLLACTWGGFPDDWWARGIARQLRTRTDIEGIQKWLSTLDPNDCQGQPLEVKFAPGVQISSAPKYVPAPASVARLGPYKSRLSRDEAGRPMILFQLGGGGYTMHWGIVVGPRDRLMPPSSNISGHWEEHYSLAPGAYIWAATETP